MRKVPLSKIKPQLLEKEKEGKLVEAFCAGVWGGYGRFYFPGLFSDEGVRMLLLFCSKEGMTRVSDQLHVHRMGGARRR